MNWKFYCTIFCVKVFLSKNSRASESNDQKQEYDRRPNLLDSFELLKYDLDIYTYVEEKEPYFKGIVRIKLICLAEANVIHLDDKYLKVHQGDVQVQELSDDLIPIGSIGVINVVSATSHTQLKIFLRQHLLIGIHYEVILEYTKPLKVTTLEEFGYVLKTYSLKPSKISKWMTFIRLNNMDISSTLPCFNDIDRKAPFKIRSYHHGNFVGFSSGFPLKTKPYDEIPGWVVDEFDETDKLAPFSIAISIMDCKKMELVDPSSNVAIRVWSDEKLIDKMVYMTEISFLCFKFFSNYFGNTGGLKKLDVIIQTADEQDYFDSYGLVTVNLAAVLYSATQGCTWRDYERFLGISQLISKQWIGHVVTPSRKEEMWLYLGLNYFLKRMCFREIHPTWEMGIMLLDLTEMYTFLLEWQPEENLQEIWESHHDIQLAELNFREMIYHKELFRLCLAKYVSTFEFANPNSKDLWNIFNDIAQEKEKVPTSISIEKVAESFFTQTGCPVILAEYNTESNLIKLEQKPYKHLEEKHEVVHKKWIIPVRFGTKTSKTQYENLPVIWIFSEIPSKKYLVVNPGDWYLLNLQLNVLAHVHYDDNNWSLIQTTLLNDHLSIDLPSRVRLVTDIFALAEAGILLYDFLFKTMQYLSKENSYSPWAVASTNFYKIRERLFGTSLFIPYQKYIMSILRPVYGRLEFNDMTHFYENDSVLFAFNMSLIELSYTFGIKSCQQKVRAYFKDIREDLRRSRDIAIPSRIFVLGLCDAVKYERNIDSKYSDYMSKNKFTDGKIEILKAFTCSSKSDLLESVLEDIWGLYEKVESTLEERVSVFRSMSQNLNYKVHNLMKQNFMKNYNFIEASYGCKALASFSMVLFEITTKQTDLNELIEFLTSKTSDTSNTDCKMKIFEKGVKKAMRNILWLGININTLKVYFKNNDFKKHNFKWKTRIFGN